MIIIDYIEALCAQANPAYVFMHEAADMINVKADAIPRDGKFCYVEAARSGSYVENPRGGRSKTLNVRLFFCQFTGLGNDLRATVLPGGQVASSEVKNEAVIDAIEAEIVEPFLKLLGEPAAAAHLTGGRSLSPIGYEYPPSRYDGNELSVMLNLTLTVPIC